MLSGGTWTAVLVERRHPVRHLVGRGLQRSTVGSRELIGGVRVCRAVAEELVPVRGAGLAGPDDRVVVAEVRERAVGPELRTPHRCGLLRHDSGRLRRGRCDPVAGVRVDRRFRVALVYDCGGGERQEHGKDCGCPAYQARSSGVRFWSLSQLCLHRSSRIENGCAGGVRTRAATPGPWHGSGRQGPFRGVARGRARWAVPSRATRCATAGTGTTCRRRSRWPRSHSSCTAPRTHRRAAGAGAAVPAAAVAVRAAGAAVPVAAVAAGVPAAGCRQWGSRRCRRCSRR